jgi:initiation factor 1A
MPANRNVKGGKGYKKGKKTGGGLERQSDFDSRGEGQDYGRVARILGNRRVALFCNDGVERICKIRGAMCRGPKKQIIGIGDVVLFSMRTFDDGSGSDSDSDGGAVGVRGSGGCGCGDIILKYEANQWRTLRKEDGVNPSLFVADAGDTVNRGPIDIFMSEKGEGGDEEEAGSGSTISHIAANYEHTAADEEMDIDLI